MRARQRCKRLLAVENAGPVLLMVQAFSWTGHAQTPRIVLRPGVELLFRDASHPTSHLRVWPLALPGMSRCSLRWVAVCTCLRCTDGKGNSQHTSRAEWHGNQVQAHPRGVLVDAEDTLCGAGPCLWSVTYDGGGAL